MSEIHHESAPFLSKKVEALCTQITASFPDLVQTIVSISRLKTSKRDSSDLVLAQQAIENFRDKIVNFQNDFLSLPPLLINLEADIRILEEQYQALQRQIAEAREEIEKAKRHDQFLTKLLSKVAFEEFFISYFSGPHRRNSEKECEGGYALFVADGKRFKLVNDKFGHLLGDAVLHRFENFLVEFTRSGHDGNEVGRLGGDEFVSFMLGVRDASAALHIATRLGRAMKHDPWPDAPEFTSEFKKHIDMDIGVIFWKQCGEFPLARGQAEAIYRQILKAADDAMYDSKFGVETGAATCLQGVLENSQFRLLGKEAKITEIF